MAWFVEKNGKTVGPLTSSQLKQLADSGDIQRSTRVKRSESDRWSEASNVKGLFNEVVSTKTVEPKSTIAVAKVPNATVENRPNTAIAKTQKTQQPLSAPNKALDAHAVVTCIPCPLCAESILPNAVKCKHCGEFLDGRNSSQPVAQQPVVIQQMVQPAPVVNVSQQMVVHHANHKRWNPFVAAILSLFLPGLGQMYKGQILNGLAWLVLTVIGYICFIIPGVVLHVCCVLGALTGNPYR
jgi:TM2 domain-containing membrane protein YozV